MTATATADTPRWPTTPCSSCAAPLIWGVTSTGDKVCVDVDPVAVNGGGGDVRLTSRGEGLPPGAVIVRHQGQMFGAREAYRRHIRTCPYADRYRYRARKRGMTS